MRTRVIRTNGCCARRTVFFLCRRRWMDCKRSSGATKTTRFVGIKSLTPGSGSPDQVVAFKINRPVGASDKPPLEGPDGAKVVSLENPKTVDFPFGLPLGVTVNYSQSVRFQQSLLTYGLIETLTWQQRDPANPDTENTCYMRGRLLIPTGPRLL